MCHKIVKYFSGFSAIKLQLKYLKIYFLNI